MREELELCGSFRRPDVRHYHTTDIFLPSRMCYLTMVSFSFGVANSLPIGEAYQAFREEKDVAEGLDEVSKGLRGLLDSLLDMSDLQLPEKSRRGSKRKAEAADDDEEEETSRKQSKTTDSYWEDITQTTKAMKPRIEATVNKWHARVHFGSEKAKSRFKAFDQTIWDQVR